MDYLNILKNRHFELLWYNKSAESAEKWVLFHKGLSAEPEKMMTEEVIGKTLFDELARTGEIGMNPEEAEDIRREMNRQMDVIRQLEAIPLDEKLPPVIHGNPYPPEIRCGLREDIPVPFDDPAEIIAQAPRHQDGFIIAPEIEHQRIG